MLDEHIEFLERALVEQQFDALAGGQLAARVLRLDALLATAFLGTGTAFIEGFENGLHGEPQPDSMSGRFVACGFGLRKQHPPARGAC